MSRSTGVVYRKDGTIDFARSGTSAPNYEQVRDSVVAGLDIDRNLFELLLLNRKMNEADADDAAGEAYNDALHAYVMDILAGNRPPPGQQGLTYEYVDFGDPRDLEEGEPADYDLVKVIPDDSHYDDARLDALEYDAIASNLIKAIDTDPNLGELRALNDGTNDEAYPKAFRAYVLGVMRGKLPAPVVPK